MTATNTQQVPKRTSQPSSRRTWVILVAVMAGLLSLDWNGALAEGPRPSGAATSAADGNAVSPTMLDRHWSGLRAMRDIATQLTYPVRSPGTVGHRKTTDFIKKELAKAPVPLLKSQEWIFRDEHGKTLKLTNLIARFSPSNPRRMIVGTHYDSIIRAYRDPDHPSAPMPGANNSASGVAVLLETARALAALPPAAIGADLVFFDGEEGPKSLGAGDPDWRALGSPYFVAHLRDLYPERKPEQSVTLDMVCYRELKLRPEQSSLASAPLEVQKFWAIGSEVAPSIFLPTPASYTVSDDHTALAAADIPSLLVIGIDYEPWFNTTRDTLDKCSPVSLEAVGRSLLRYIYGVK